MISRRQFLINGPKCLVGLFIGANVVEQIEPKAEGIQTKFAKKNWPKLVEKNSNHKWICGFDSADELSHDKMTFLQKRLNECKWDITPDYEACSKYKNVLADFTPSDWAKYIETVWLDGKIVYTTLVDKKL